MYWTQQSEGPCLGGEGDTAMMQIIAGLTGQVVGGRGLYKCTGHNGVQGHVWGRGGYCNDANYYRIDRPGCGGGLYECTGHNGVKGHVWGGGGVPQ